MKPSNALKAADFSVQDVSHREAIDLVEHLHYAKGGPNTSVYRHGLYGADSGLLGVAMWLPPTKVAAQSVGGDEWPWVLSLTRLVVAPDVPTNGASFLLGRSIRLIRRAGIWRHLVTYADEGQGHTKVCEPFAGAAGYSTFYDVEQARLLDADPIISGLWRYLITASPEEIMALPELPEVGDSVDNYDLPDAAKWLIGFWLNRGSATPKKSRTAYSARTDKAQLNWGLRAKERIAGQLEQIRGWRVVGNDFRQVPDAEVTWFVDPPYVEKGRYYRVPFAEYSDLAAWCIERRGQVIVCEGDGADWLPFEPLGRFKTSTGSAREVVWTNGRLD